MRIIKLTFENLASLTGKWTINFQNESFLENGIFAIIGPTGSGKTTILDAITLALYAKTDRLGKSFSENTNEIMSRNTNYCMASVDFSTAQGFYRATFEHKKTVRKNASKPFGKPQWTLCSIDENGNILNDLTPPKEKENKQTEIIGMDFDQFTRSVILPQGKFQEFLKADGEKQAALLEKITGTQIYRTIGQKVAEQYSLRTQELKEAKLKAESLLKLLVADNEIALLQNNVKDLPEKIQKGKSEEDRLNTIIIWLNKIIAIEKELNDLQNEEKALISENTAFSPREQKLQSDAKARPFVADNSILSEEERYIQEEKNKLKNNKDLLENLINDYNRIKENLKQAYNDFEKAKLNQKEAEPKIRKAREYDALLRMNTDQYQQAELNLITETKKLEKLKSNISALKKIREKNDELEKKKSELEKKKQSEFGELTAMELADKYQKLSQNLVDWNKLKEIISEIKDISDQLEKEKANVVNTKTILQTLEEEQSTYLKEDTELTIHIETISKEVQRARSIIQLEKERALLKEGEECPLCGAIHHPYKGGNITFPTNAEKELEDLQKRKTELINQGNTISKNIGIQETAHNNLLENIKTLSNKLEKQNGFLTSILTTMNRDSQPTYEEVTTQCEILEQEINPLQIKKKQAAELEKNISNNQKEIDSIKSNLDELKEAETELKLTTEQLNNAQKIKKTIEDKISKINQERAMLQLGDPNPDQWEKTLREKVESTGDLYNKTNISLTKTESDKKNKNIEISDMETALTGTESKYKEKEKDLLTKITMAGFKDLPDYRNALLDDKTQEEYKKEQGELKQKTDNHKGRQDSAKKRYADAVAQKMTDLSLQEIQVKYAECQQTIEQDQRTLTQIQLMLEDQDKFKKQYAIHKDEINKKEKIATQWSNLNDLIGQKSNTKFASIVQRLSLERLLDFANNQLEFLNKRYRLTIVNKSNNSDDQPFVSNTNTKTEISDEIEVTNSESDQKKKSAKEKIKTSLDDSKLPPIYCIDTFMADELRPTSNLSGGETFQISLALALGLSKMSSKDVTIDSLFLDEGFGTLDKEALETALNALGQFRVSDKTEKIIGIISHVSALSEQIPNKIQISKKSLGSSTIKGPGINNN